MTAHDWGILALRLTAIYLLVQSLFWFVGWITFLTVILFSTLPADDSERLWYQLKVNASVLLPAIEYYVLGMWYWRAAPRITAPFAETTSEPTTASPADEKCAPLWIAMLALWGSTVDLIPATRNLFGVLFLSDFVGLGNGELSLLVGEIFVRREFGLRVHLIDFAIALLEAVAARPIVGMLMRAKRRFQSTPDAGSAAVA